LSPLIEVRRLRKIYYSETDLVHALEGADVTAAEGEFVSIVGPSGCGKSTLVKILAGLYPATSGHVRVNGAPVTGPLVDAGIVFQNPSLMKWRTVLDNILLPAEIRGLDAAVHRRRALELVKLVGIHGFEDVYPFQLSGGMQQRAAICRALIHDPRLLLMDEPFGALDALTREQMNLELMRIWGASRKTVLFITHSIPEAVFLSDRVLVMSPRPGRVVEDVTVPLPRPRTVKTMESHDFVDTVGHIRRLMSAGGSLD
jgi:NitT/TauT family transport system ATP-binding protein